MKNFIVGAIFGIVVATVGFTGIAHILDKAVDVTKEQAAKAATKE